MSGEHEEYDAVMNCTIMRLRARAEKAEAELAALRASLADENHPPHDEEHGCSSHSCLIATRVGGVGTNGPCSCVESSVPSRAKARIIERALRRGRQAVASLPELAALRWWVSLPSSSVGRLSPQLWRAATGIQTIPGGECDQIDADGPSAVAAVLALYAKCVTKNGESDER